MHQDGVDVDVDVDVDQSRNLLEEDEGVCTIPITFDPALRSTRKCIRTVGVLAIRGFEAAYKEFIKTLNE
jgi:hypothetical protein